MKEENINNDITDQEGNFNEETGNGKSQTGDENIDYKSRYANSTREYQKIAEEKKAIEEDIVIQKAYRQVMKDNTSLLEMNEEIGQKVFEELLNDGFVAEGISSYEELIEQLQGGGKEATKPLDEKELTKKIKASLLEEQKAEKANEFISETLSKYDEETKKKYLAEFKEVLGDRKLTPEFAKKELDKIIFYYNKDKIMKTKSDEALTNLASNGISTGNRSEGTIMTREKLTSYGMPEREQKRLYPELFSNNK